MADYKNMKMIDLYSSLGYERKSSKRRFETLNAAASSFLREYVNQGNEILRTTANLEGARLCALNFLHEDERGERFWPISADGKNLQWAKDCDREAITAMLTHIFYKKNYSDYVKRKRQSKDRKKAEDKKKSNKRTHDDDDYLETTNEEPTPEEKACIPSDLELNTVKFWKVPPEQPSATHCCNYIRTLNPQLDLKPEKEFQRNWLNKKSPKWPKSADNRLLRFMFDHEFFIVYDHGDEIPPGFLRLLREETEIEEMNGLEYSKFQNIVAGRVKELTHQLTQKPCLILEYRRDGVIQMTERFERIWKARELHWEDTSEPPKKRKKSKTVRAKPPLVIPTLREQDHVRAELLSAQVDQGSKLTSMAETALDLFAGQEESDKRRGEQPFITEFMNVDLEFELDTPSSPASRRRSFSLGESIIVECERDRRAQAGDTTPALAPLQENQLSDKGGSGSPTLEHMPCTNASGRPTLLLEVPMPVPAKATYPIDYEVVGLTAINTTSELDQAQKPQQATNETCSLTHEMPITNRSGGKSTQNVSPTEPTASPSVDEANSTFPSILSSKSPSVGRLSPFEMLGNPNRPSISDTKSTMAASGLVKLPSQQPGQPMEGMVNTEAQPPFGNTFSPNAMNMHSLFGSNGSFGGNIHPSSPDQQRTAPRTPPLSNRAAQYLACHQACELSPSPTREGMVKRKGLRHVDEISRPAPATLGTSEPHSKPFSVIEDLEVTCSGSLAETIMPESNSKTSDSASQFSVTNKSPESPASTNFCWQRSEPFDKVVAKPNAVDQPTRQVSCDGDAPLVASCAPKSIDRAPTEKVSASQPILEGQSSARISNSNQECNAPSSILAKGINSSDPNKPANVNNSVNEIDSLVQIENNPLEPLSLDPQTTSDQSARLQSPLTQETDIEEQESSKTLQNSLRNPVQPGLLSPAVATFPVHPTYQSMYAQPEKQVRLEESTQDLTPRPEKGIAMPVQEPLTLPQQGTPQRRNGSYSFVPPPEAFTLHKPATTPPLDLHRPPPPVLSTDRRLTTISTPSGASDTPTLTLLIESADGSMSLGTAHSFEIVKNSSLSEFFQFYSSVSGAPLSALTSLEFQPAFGKRQSIEIRRYGGEDKWKELKEVITALFVRARRKDTEGRMEWQVLISCD